MQTHNHIIINAQLKKSIEATYETRQHNYGNKHHIKGI